MERRSNVQLIISISSILSVIVASISIISFTQLAERRITTMEVRIEYLSKQIESTLDRMRK